MLQSNSVIMQDVSLDQDRESTPVLMLVNYMCAIQAVWTGSPTGTFSIETSCDEGKIDPATNTVTGITNWTFYDGSDQAAGGAAGQFVWRINVLPEKWVRLKYTYSSGSGTVTARVNTKGVI
jgi:hypothetical protein